MNQKNIAQQQVKCTHIEVTLRSSTIEIWWQCKDCAQKFEKVWKHDKALGREELSKQFCALTCPNPEDHSRWSPTPCEQVAEKVERLLAQEREKYLEALCASVCSFCALPQKYDLHAPLNVGRGYWCHTEKGVSPTWENKRCVAMSFRNVNRDLDLTKLDEGGEEKVNG